MMQDECGILQSRDSHAGTGGVILWLEATVPRDGNAMRN